MVLASERFIDASLCSLVGFYVHYVFFGKFHVFYKEICHDLSVRNYILPFITAIVMRSFGSQLTTLECCLDGILHFSQ